MSFNSSLSVVISTGNIGYIIIITNESACHSFPCKPTVSFMFADATAAWPSGALIHLKTFLISKHVPVTYWYTTNAIPTSCCMSFQLFCVKSLALSLAPFLAPLFHRLSLIGQ